jgi:hypothetical protein
LEDGGFEEGWGKATAVDAAAAAAIATAAATSTCGLVGREERGGGWWRVPAASGRERADSRDWSWEAGARVGGGGEGVAGGKL